MPIPVPALQPAFGKQAIVPGRAESWYNVGLAWILDFVVPMKHCSCIVRLLVSLRRVRFTYRLHEGCNVSEESFQRYACTLRFPHAE